MSEPPLVTPPVLGQFNNLKNSKMLEDKNIRDQVIFNVSMLYHSFALFTLHLIYKPLYELVAICSLTFPTVTF